MWSANNHMQSLKAMFVVLVFYVESFVTEHISVSFVRTQVGIKTSYVKVR